MNRYKLMRFGRGLTLADVVTGSGVSERTLIRLENGGSPSSQVAKALADFYGITVAELLGVTEREAA